MSRFSCREACRQEALGTEEKTMYLQVWILCVGLGVRGLVYLPRHVAAFFGCLSSYSRALTLTVKLHHPEKGYYNSGSG